MTLQDRILALAPWHQILDFGAGLQTPGRWNPKLQAEAIAGWVPGGIVGRSVLDIGSNAGGIGLELLKMGASKVTLLEKHPKYHSQAELYLDIMKPSSISAVQGSAYDVHRMPQADVKLWLGLAYHVRHPQLFLDYAASTGGGVHVFSTQISEGIGSTEDECLGLFNRKPLYPNLSSPLLGWEATSVAFQSMLKLSGYEILSSHRRSGQEWTNSFYVVCKPPNRPTCNVESAANILDANGNWF